MTDIAIVNKRPNPISLTLRERLPGTDKTSHRLVPGTNRVPLAVLERLDRSAQRFLEDGKIAGWIDLHEWSAADDLKVVRRQAEIEKKRAGVVGATGCLCTIG